MKFLWITVIAAFMLLLVSCSDLLTEPKLPSWLGTLEVPFMHEVVTTDSLVTDETLIFVDPNIEYESGYYMLVDSLTMDPVTVGNRLSTDEINTHFTQFIDDVEVQDEERVDLFTFDPVAVDAVADTFLAEIGEMDLALIPPETTEPILFEEILPLPVLAAINDQIQLSGEAQLPIFPFELDPYIREINFSQFYNVQVAHGSLQLTLTNNLPIAMGAPIYVEVVDTAGTSLGTAVYNETIGVGGSQNAILPLDGIDFTNHLEVFVSGQMEGSGGETVTLTESDLSRSFIVTGELLALSIQNGDAEIPMQTFSGQDNYLFDSAEENKIASAELADGQLSVGLHNQLPLDLVLVLDIENLQHQGTGQSLQIDFELAAGATDMQTIDLLAYSLEMDIAAQELTYNYSVETVPSSGSVTITSADAVELNLNLRSGESEEIVVSNINGIIAPQEILNTGTFELETSSSIYEALLIDGLVTIEMQNEIGGSGYFIIELLNIQETLSFQPGFNDYTLSLADQELDFPDGNQIIPYSIQVHTEEGIQADYALQEAITTHAMITDLQFETITGYFNEDAMVKEDSLAVGSEHQITQGDIEAGVLLLVLDNKMGAGAQITFHIQELTQSNNSFQTQFELLPESGPQLHQFDLTGYQLGLPLENQYIHYRTTASLNTSELYTLNVQDSIAVDVTVSGLSFSTVEGLIAPVEVAVDTVQETFDDLNEHPGVLFDRAVVWIDMDSEIELPVLVDLDLRSVNSDGEEAQVVLTNWNITDSSRIVIKNVAPLLNIFPNTLTVTGIARVGDGITFGTISQEQTVAGEVTVRIPLIFQIVDPQPVDSDPEFLEMDIPDEIHSFTLVGLIENSFSNGARIQFLASKDSLVLIGEGASSPETLADIELSPFDVYEIEVDLDEEQITLLTDSVYVQAIVTLIGPEGPPGDPPVVTVTPADSIVIRSYCRMTVEVKGEE